MYKNESKRAVPLSDSDGRARQITSFLTSCGYESAEMSPLCGDASFRRYIRIKKDGKSIMLMDAPPQKEDVRKYLVVAEYLYKHGYSTPTIEGSNIPDGFLLLEDFGDDVFSDLIEKEAEESRQEKEEKLYEGAIDVLVEWYLKKSTIVNPALLQLSEYNEKFLMREVELLAEWFLPQIFDAQEADELGKEFMEIWRVLISSARLRYDCLVHRDYHAQNLMWLPNRSGVQRVGLLDFQDAVYGDPAYDVVSLLEDARRDVPASIVQYCQLGYLYGTKMNKDRFMASYALLGAQRNCKILGIFVRLAVRDNKEDYLKLLPRVWEHLQYDLQSSELSSLKEWMDKHIAPKFCGTLTLQSEQEQTDE